jgi:signal transduction histidine kinase
MADRLRSLRRRFAVWFGLLFILGAVMLRLAHYRTTIDMLARDVDVQLWSRLAAVKAQERFAPDTLLDPHLRAEGVFLPTLQAPADWAVPRVLGWALPRLVPPVHAPFTWFAGVWTTNGTLVDDLDLPVGVRFDPAWSRRLDTHWTSADGAYRLAATAGAHDTLLVAGAPLKSLAAAERQAAWYQVLTFVLWVPLVLGTAWVLLSSMLVPAARLAAIARRIRAGHFGERIDVLRADSEFAEAAHALNAMLDQLDTIRLAQSRFNADVAHQLLNPVHAILLETEAADRAVDPAARFSRIAGLGHRIEALCETLLTYSRSAALDEVRLRAVDLEPIVAAAVDRTAAEAERRGITVAPPETGAIVKGDAALLEEVFVNLLVNALEHSPTAARIDVTIDRDGDACRVAVIDHGPGVPPADVPGLFERFHSGKAAGGHGIGLALSRIIARSHGGDVTHSPTPGGGATFTVRLPAMA